MFFEGKLVSSGLCRLFVGWGGGGGGGGGGLEEGGRGLGGMTRLISRVEKKRKTHPVSLLEHEPSQTMCAGGDEAGRTADEALVDDAGLEKVLCKGAGIQVVIVGLGDPTQEAHGTGPAKLELEHAEHEAFGLLDLVHGVATVDHVHHLRDRGRVDLLVLGRDQQRRRADELQLAERHDLARQEPVDEVDAQEQRLRQQMKTSVHLDDPVDEHGPHRPLNLGLVVHVVRVRQHLDLFRGRIRASA